MPSYTLCPSYMKIACNDNKHFLNVLLKFVQNHGLKLNLDERGRVLEEYSTAIGTNENFKTFLKFLTPESITTLDVNQNDLDIRVYLIKLTSGIFGLDKVICTDDKNLFTGFESSFHEYSISLEDKSEFYFRINHKGNTFNITTGGDNSPIIVGDSNQT